MKKGGCALLGCLAVVGLLALAGLAVVGMFSSEDATEPDLTELEETEEESGEAEEPEEESSSERPEPDRPLSNDPDLLRLTFRFRDADERLRRLTCTIRRSDYERERAGFGYVEAQRIEELNRTFRELLEREAVARGVSRYFTIEVYGEGSLRWNWRYPEGTDSAAVRRVQEFHAWLEKEAQEARGAMEESYYHAHGMRLKDDTIRVDYERLALQGTEPLTDCFAALRGVAGGRAGSLLDQILPFFQDLRYELPRNVDGEGRETLGFRVPTEVLVAGAGDCDSKAVAFCALWRQIPARVLLVLVPGHALVAVEGKPGPGQESVRMGNRYYILCEVAGPGRFRPGETDVSGSFEYILIEPV